MPIMNIATPGERREIYQTVLELFLEEENSSPFVCDEMLELFEREERRKCAKNEVAWITLFPEFLKQKPPHCDIGWIWWVEHDKGSRIEALEAAIKLC